MASRLVKHPTRTAVRLRLEAMLRERSLWGQQLVGERELAVELGVGRKTLRAALADLEADGTVERRQGAGTFVAPGGPARPRSGATTVQVAVITASHFEQAVGWDYKGEMIRGLLGQGSCSRVECAVLALDRPEQAEQVGDDRRMRRFDGFVAVGVDDRELLSRLLALRRGPVVLLDHNYRDLGIVGVVDGSFEGARAVTRHLLALGHRRIAFLDCPNREEENPEKFAGYRAGLAGHGIAVDDRLVFVPERPLPQINMQRLADNAVGGLLALHDPPTAIFGFDDNWALPAACALERRGLRVGVDVSVAGYGDSAIRRGLSSSLTSCRIYPRKMGREALRVAMHGDAFSKLKNAVQGRTVVVPDRLYIRQSTCPPPCAAGR